MSPIIPYLIPNTLVLRDGAVHQSTSLSTRSEDVTSKHLQVICAWPVSGAYGPGPRTIYYVLVAIFVFSRKYQGLRDAALATALLFPGIAACHGVVLAAVHVNGVIDMDIYGAFQVCTIAVMASPLTVRLSQTYFYYRGINIVLMWSALILAGLLSLTVEFYRSHSFDCHADASGIPVPPGAKLFPYGTNITCGIPCSAGLAPNSPLRGGSSDNVYVVPAPDKLTIGTATILSAACCVPAFLSLIAVCYRVVEFNWNARFGFDGYDVDDQQIEGANGITIAKMKNVNRMMKIFFTAAVQVPVSAATVIAIIVLGERNFFSAQVLHYTEPAATIGQWAPILTTVGSLYLIFVLGMEGASGRHEFRDNRPEDSPSVPVTENMPDNEGVHQRPEKSQGSSALMRGARGAVWPKDGSQFPGSNNMLSVTNPHGGDLQDNVSMTSRASSRHRVAKTLLAVGRKLGSVPLERSEDESEFKGGKARIFPEIPGEEFRNESLPRIREHYRQQRGLPEQLRPIRSRSGSFGEGIGAGDGIMRPTTPEAAVVSLLHPLQSTSPQSQSIEADEIRQIEPRKAD